MSAVSLAAGEPASRAGGRALAAAGAGAALIGALAVAVIASRHAAPSVVSPVTPRGGWNAAWIGGLAAAFVLYGVGIALQRRARLRLRLVVGIAVVVQALPLAAPLLLSKDVYLYWGEGRVLVAHHANPYRATPADFPADPAARWVSDEWRARPAPYGPGWELVAAVPAAAAGGSRTAAELAYRALALVSVLALVVLVGLRAGVAGAAVLGWNPLVALHFGGGGHGDSTMMLLVVAALAAGATARGGALWPVASAFKPFPPVLVPLELARRRLAMGTRWWLGLIGSTAGVVGISVALFGTRWVHAATVGARESSPLGGVHWLTQLGLVHRDAVLVGAAVFLVVYLALLRDAWVRRRARLSLAAAALCLTSSLLRPWYVLWPLALAAFEDDALGVAAAYALTGYLLFGDAVQL